jgi:hypothetical protein
MVEVRLAFDDVAVNCQGRCTICMIRSGTILTIGNCPLIQTGRKWPLDSDKLQCHSRQSARGRPVVHRAWRMLPGAFIHEEVGV